MAGGFGHEGDRLSAFLDDELDERDALHVTRHLRRCPDCTDELEQLRATRAALRALPPVAPSLSWMVETAVLGPGERPTGRLAAVLAPIALAVLGAAGIVLVGAFLLGASDGSVQPPVDRMVVDHVRSVEGSPVVTPVRLSGDPGTGG